MDDHGMNPGSPALFDLRLGWTGRKAQVGALRVLAAAMVSEVSPP